MGLMIALHKSRVNFLSQNFFFCDITLHLRMIVVQRFETVWWPHIQESMDHCFVRPLTLEERISQSAPFR